MCREKDGTADVTVFLVGKWKGKAWGDPAVKFSPGPERDRGGGGGPAVPMVRGN